jgi:hypothetical protein
MSAPFRRSLRVKAHDSSESSRRRHGCRRWSRPWCFACLIQGACHRLQCGLSYWYILGLHVLYAAVFFPFRQTYAIEYFQHAKGLTLQQAGNVNSGVFAAAVFATPFFGLLSQRRCARPTK